jgi:murein peptide amidase A
VWIIPTLNPDGVAAHTRQNAHGVDLNRNFPWQWRPPDSRGYRYYSGPRALSEPESRLASDLILDLRPALSIWFHQPYGLVDASGGDVRLERRFSDFVGLPLVRLPRYPGSVTSWENHRFPGTTAFVVELRAGSLSQAAATRFAHAVLAVAGES